MEIAKVIGNNIRMYRQVNDIKQEVLAKQIGVTKSRLSQIENGQCAELTLSRLENIAEVLEINFFDLVGNKGNNIMISNATNCTNGYHVTNNAPPELINQIITELVARLKA
jgi:transcriptional regulator with XRE-family HTH domain